MGEILIDIRTSRGGLVGITEMGKEINLGLPCPELGLLGQLPDKIKVGSVQYGKWLDRMIRKKILDNPPYPDYIRLGISNMILEDRTVVIAYDEYCRTD